MFLWLNIEKEEMEGRNDTEHIATRRERGYRINECEPLVPVFSAHTTDETLHKIGSIDRRSSRLVENVESVAQG